MNHRDIPITYDPPHHMNHCKPLGLLPTIQQAPALWQFLIMAHTILDKVPAQATLEENPDITVDLRTVAESVTAMYGVTLEEMFHPALVGIARLEAERVKAIWDDRITAWIDSGGRSYNIVTRDPDKISE
jgi:hypothetical protein